MGKQFGNIPKIGYIPSLDKTQDVISDIQQSDYFLRNFKTPSDIEEYKNYILDTQFQEMGVPSPYQKVGEYRSIFNKNATYPEFSPTDTPEQKLFKEISARLVKNKGKLPEPSFFEKVIGSSMTAGWIKMLTGNDINGAYNGVYQSEDGFGYDGKVLNLTKEQNKTVADFISRVTGADSKDDFWDKTIQTAMSLAFDLPLLAITGGIAGGVMKATSVGQALMNSPRILPRLVGQVVQQAVNFNLLGLPQTVESLRYEGTEGALKSIFNNVMMGSLAAGTGAMGVAVGRQIGKIWMSKTPALQEELSGLAGSFGFGYLSGKVAGESNQDAISQGLAFAATHFTNPRAYTRVIKEIQSKDVKVALEKFDGVTPITGKDPDYFIEKKDGKLYKIDKEAFQNEGVITETGAVPLEMTDGNRNKMAYFNEVQNSYLASYGDALEYARKKKLGKELYDRWTKDKDADYVKKNEPQLRGFAESISAALVGTNLRKTFAKWKLPQDVNLDNKMIKLSNDFSLPYSDVKRFIVENINEYFANPEDFVARLQENPMVAKDLDNVLKAAGEAIIKQAKANYAQELLSKSGLPAAKQLTEGVPIEPPKLVDLKTEAERIRTKVERDNLKAKAVEGVVPTELKPDKYVFYDFNGELVPMVKSKGKLTIAGTNVEIPFEIVKDKVKTKADIVKEVKEKASKKTEVKPEDAETAYVKKALKEAGGVEKLSPDQMLEVTRKAREEYQAKNPVEVKVEKPVEPTEVKPIEPIVETKPENKPGITPISTVEEITKVNTNTLPNETEPINEPKKDFEFENYNLLNIADKIVNNKNYAISPEGKKEIVDVINDIKDKAAKQGVPEKDIRDFTMLVLKKSNKLSAEKVATMMKLVDANTTEDMVKNAVKRKSKTYNDLVNKFVLRNEPVIESNNYTKGADNRMAMFKQTEKVLSGEDLSGKDIGLASLQGEEAVGIKPRVIQRKSPETILKNAEGVVRQVLSKYDINDDKQYRQALDDIAKNKYLEGGGLTETAYAMLQNARLGRDLRDNELVEPTLMFETRTPSKPATLEELNAGIEEMKAVGFDFNLGIVPQDKAPKGKVLAGVTFRDPITGEVKAIIDKRYADKNTIQEEAFHSYMLMANGNDRKLVDKVLKDYGWDGGDNQSLVDAHHEIIKEVRNIKPRSLFVQKLIETWQKWANLLQGKGFYSEAQLFRKLAAGQIDIGEPARVPDLTFYERANGNPDAVRFTLKSFDSIIDKETLTINDAFWNRLKNKGVKDAEINYFKTFLEDGTKLKGEEFKSAVMEKMFPMEIKKMGGRSFRDHDEEGGDPYYNLTTSNQNLINGDKREQATNYRVLSFDLPKQVIKQVHNYWGNRKESVGWARVEDEVIDGIKTGYLNVNEIQGQLQYTDMPKFSDLEVNDVIKMDGTKFIVQKIESHYGSQDVNKVQLLDASLKDVEKSFWINERDYIERTKMGSQPEFLQSLKPVFTDLQIKSLIQYAADNGYKGVRFPTMKSISKIEGFDHLMEAINITKERILNYADAIGKVKNDTFPKAKDDINGIAIDKDTYLRRHGNRYAKVRMSDDTILAVFNKETMIKILEEGKTKQERHLRNLTAGDTAKKMNAVKNYYEETVGMTGKRLRKENWNKVNDVYGNEWFETEIQANDTDPLKFYHTMEKPFEGEDDITQLGTFDRILREQQKKYSEKGLKAIFNNDNKLSSTFQYVKGKIIESAIQSNNYVSQVDKNGKYIHPHEKELYDMAANLLVNKVPYDRNTILKNERGWNQGRYFRDLDDNSRSDFTNRTDMASKINQYHLDIYWGRAEAPSVKEGETMQQAHTRIGKEIGLTDKQIEADWKTQQAYREANNKAYNATIDMYANLKDTENGDYIVSNGLNRKKLNDIFGIDKSVTDELAYKQAKEIINSDPEKRFEVAVELANKSPFYERNNPFYHSDVRPSNPKFWIISGWRPTEGEISDRFFSYAENKKQFEQIRKEWSDRGYAIDQEYNIGKEIADKRYNRLSANQLINLANAGHIPINNETVQALLEATKSGRFEQHNLEKKYIPGMHGTAKEYERQLINFVDEAISASTRRYALDKMRDFILEKKTMYNANIKDPAVSEADKTKLRLADEWMTQFYNQVSQSDRSVVDGLRELATSYYIAFKPSFSAMQMFQPIQMALPEAVKEAGSAGTGIWTKSFVDAWNLAYEIKARQKGETTGKVDEELYRIYDKFDKMQKMGATGIRELTGEAGDVELHYGSDMYKGWKTFIKIGNMAGAIAEKYTRLQSLNMWYEIGKNKGLQGEALEKFILSKHDDIMSLWGASGRPVLGQSKDLGVQQQKAIKGFMKSFFTFKTYTLANLGQYDRLMRSRNWGALGAKMAVGIGIHGITKFPLMASFYALYNLLADDDLEYEEIKALDEINAGLIGRGVSSILPINIQNMFDERTAFVSDAFAETRSKSAEGKLLEVMLGAPYGVPKDVIEGASAMHKLVMDKIDDDVMLTDDERLRAKKNWNKILPLAARNIFNGMNMKDDGIQVRGKELVKSDDITWADVVYKWLGFNPAKVANAYELQFSGFPAKWARINGKITELKKIRKEISDPKTSKGYTPLERKTELLAVKRLIEEAQAEQSALRRTPDYRSAIKQGLIKP